MRNQSLVPFLGDFRSHFSSKNNKIRFRMTKFRNNRQLRLGNEAQTRATIKPGILFWWRDLTSYKQFCFLSLREGWQISCHIPHFLSMLHWSIYEAELQRHCAKYCLLMCNTKRAIYLVLVFLRCEFQSRFSKPCNTVGRICSKCNILPAIL